MKSSMVLVTSIAALLLTGGSLWGFAGNRADPPKASLSLAREAAAGFSQEVEHEQSEPAPTDSSAPEEPDSAAAAPDTTAPAASQPAGGAPATRGQIGTGGVLHLQADHTWTSPQGEQRPPVQAEVWLDLETGDARLSEKDSTGSLDVTSVRSGLRLTRLLPLEKRAQTQVAPDEYAPFLSEISANVLGTKAALEQGALEIVGEDTVNAEPAVRVQAPGTGETSLLDLFIGKDHRLLLKEVAYQLGPDGDRQEVLTHSVSYRLVESLNRREVPPEVFSPSIPGDWEWVTSEMLDLTSAGAFPLFDIYWLGSSYTGMTLVRMLYEDVVRPSGRLSFFVLEYTQPPAEGQSSSQTPLSQFSLVHRPGLSSDELAGRPTGESLTVSGRRATLFVPQAPPAQQGGAAQQVPAAGQAFPTVLELSVGDRLVVMYGKDRAQVLQAARDLQRLN